MSKQKDDIILYFVTKALSIITFLISFSFFLSDLFFGECTMLRFAVWVIGMAIGLSIYFYSGYDVVDNNRKE